MSTLCARPTSMQPHVLICIRCHAVYAGDAPDASVSLVTIGDKGRSQLSRVAPEKLILSVADTYKNKVTFPQVRWRLAGLKCCWGCCMPT